VALVLAAALWFYASTEHRYERILEVPVLAETGVAGEPEDSLVVTAPLPATATIVVSGVGRDLLRLDDESFFCRLHLEGPVGLLRTYRLTPASVERRGVEADVTVERVVQPVEVTAAVDRRAQRSLPVVLAVDLAPAPGYVVVGRPWAEPAQVVVTGPRSVLATLRSAPADTLILTHLRDDVDAMARISWPAGSTVASQPGQVRVRAAVQPVAEADYVQVAIRIRGGLPGAVTAEPPTAAVRLRGGVEALAAIDPLVDPRLFVDGRPGPGAVVPVQCEPDARFVVVAIAPAAVTLAPHH
jgi:hypothetical protein